MQALEALDPRCYAPVGIEPRTRALLTAVPYRGALLREGLAATVAPVPASVVAAGAVEGAGSVVGRSVRASIGHDGGVITTAGECEGRRRAAQEENQQNLRCSAHGGLVP